MEVLTDEGPIGVGASSRVIGCRKRLRPQWEGEWPWSERVSEKLRQSSFWQGRGGTVEHVISGIDIALWDLMGRSCNQPVSRLLGGCYRTRIKPYGSLLFDEPPRLRDTLQATVARGFKAIKLGWRPFGRRNAKFDELLIRTARDAVGPDVELLVDAGGSEQFWPHGYKWALQHGPMMANYDIGWFEESALPPDDIEGFIQLRARARCRSPGRSADAAAVVHTLDRDAGRWTSCSPTRPSAAA